MHSFFFKKSVSEWFSIKKLTEEISQMDKIGFIETKEHIACKITKLELDQMIFWWKFNFFKNIIKKCHKNTEFVKKITLFFKSQNQKSKTYKSCLNILSSICMSSFFDFLPQKKVLVFFWHQFFKPKNEKVPF